MRSIGSCVATTLFAGITLVACSIPSPASAIEPSLVTPNGYQPAPSADGGWIAFRLGSSIAKVRPDGTGLTTLVEGIDPNWSRPGELILFTDYSNRMFTVDATTAETTHVWSGSGLMRCDHPAWSPVADEIAASGPALITVHYPYGPAQPVACGCDDIQTSAWSPDGQSIAFDTGDIYRVSRTGGTPLLVAGGPLSQRYPTWSPDGRFIAFAQRDDVLDDYWHIWVADARGESFGKVQLTTGTYSDLYPAWSPDGTALYFDSNRSGGGIWKLLVDYSLVSRPSTWGALKQLYR